MRVSKYFKLGRAQPTLDFVDVDYRRDTRLFISPKAVAALPSAMGNECVHLIQDYFSCVLAHIKAGRHGDAERLLSALKEPNETHLGLSKGKSRGRALGELSARDVWHALSRSQAAKSGLITDLEDTVLLIMGISVDIISDITTNIIRGPLIQYTQEMSRQYGIPLQQGIPSGPVWVPGKKEWQEGLVDLPMTPEGKLLLVPKAIVRRHLAYALEDYYRNYMLTHLQAIELSANSALVEVIKKTKQRVVRKSKVIEKYNIEGKKDIIDLTLDNPEVLEKFKREKAKQPFPILDHDIIAAVEGTSEPDWDTLLDEVLNCPTGVAAAKQYEKAIESLLSALFYPDLVHPVVQSPLHEGKKVVDISYTNAANSGFFKWISQHYPSGQIFVECKNYDADISNPELDQLSGRFSPSRGKVGISVSRKFNDKARFVERCRDTANDDRGFIITLDDNDLKALVATRKAGGLFQAWPLLRASFMKLVN